MQVYFENVLFNLQFETYYFSFIDNANYLFEEDNFLYDKRFRICFYVIKKGNN